MYKPKANLKYLGYDPISSKELGFPKAKWYNAKVEKNYIKRYHCSLSTLIKLSKSARVVLDVSVQFMSETNEVANNSVFKAHINRIVSIHAKPFSENTINKAFVELTKEGFLSKSKRGVYKVNPLYFYNGTEENRLKEIRKDLEKPVKKLAERKTKSYKDKFKK